jgi:Xaa-Pro dipeptidase
MGTLSEGIPFDAAKLERLMTEAGIDAILASSRHNVRYLTGGYYIPFHAHISRGLTGRYLALVGVPRDIPRAFYVGQYSRSEGSEESALGAFGPFWIQDRRWASQPPGRDGAGMTVAAPWMAAQALQEMGLGRGRIALEFPFLPADAYSTLLEEVPEATLVDATPVLAELRAVKRPDELALMREVNRVTDEGIRAVLREGRPEQTTAEVAEALRRRVGETGCTYLFAFVNVGPGALRWPSGQVRRERGRPLHIDAGAALRDYLSDVTRMGSVGEPPSLARRLFESCCEIQERLQREIRPGLACGELHRLGRALMEATPWREHAHFVVHGIGMVNREYPLITAGRSRSKIPWRSLPTAAPTWASRAGNGWWPDRPRAIGVAGHPAQREPTRRMRR